MSRKNVEKLTNGSAEEVIANSAIATSSVSTSNNSSENEDVTLNDENDNEENAENDEITDETTDENEGLFDDDDATADYSPALGSYSGVKKFKAWVQATLPMLYDDSLSWMELISKIMWYLNTLIQDVDTTEENIALLHDAYDNLENFVNEYYGEFRQEVKDEIASFEQNIKDWLANIDTDMQNFKDSVNQQFTDLSDEFNTKFETLSNDINNEVDEKIAEFDKTVTETIEKLTESVNTTIENVTNSVNEEITKLENNVDDKISELDSNVTQAITDMQNEMASLKADIQAQIDALSGDFSETIAKYQATFSELMEQFKTDYEQYSGEIEAKTTELDEKVAQYESDISNQYDSYVNSLNEKLSDFNILIKGYQDVYNEDLSNFETTINKYIANLDETVEKYLNNYLTDDKLKELLEELNIKVDSFDTLVTRIAGSTTSNWSTHYENTCHFTSESATRISGVPTSTSSFPLGDDYEILDCCEAILNTTQPYILVDMCYIYFVKGTGDYGNYTGNTYYGLIVADNDNAYIKSLLFTSNSTADPMSDDTKICINYSDTDNSYSCYLMLTCNTDSTTPSLFLQSLGAFPSTSYTGYSKATQKYTMFTDLAIQGVRGSAAMSQNGNFNSSNYCGLVGLIYSANTLIWFTTQHNGANFPLYQTDAYIDYTRMKFVSMCGGKDCNCYVLYTYDDEEYNYLLRQYRANNEYVDYYIESSYEIRAISLQTGMPTNTSNYSMYMGQIRLYSKNGMTDVVKINNYVSTDIVPSNKIFGFLPFNPYNISAYNSGVYTNMANIICSNSTTDRVNVYYVSSIYMPCEISEIYNCNIVCFISAGLDIELYKTQSGTFHGEYSWTNGNGNSKWIRITLTPDSSDKYKLNASCIFIENVGVSESEDYTFDYFLSNFANDRGYTTCSCGYYIKQTNMKVPSDYSFGSYILNNIVIAHTACS